MDKEGIYYNDKNEYEQEILEERIKIINERDSLLRSKELFFKEGRSAYIKRNIFLIIYISLLPILLGIFYQTFRWLGAVADERVTRAKTSEIEFYIARSNANIPEVQIVTEYVTLEHSWLYTFFWNWALPSIGFAVGVAIIGVIIFEIYKRYIITEKSDSVRSFSVFSVSVSMTSMVFAVLKYQQDLLQHEVGSYIFLSSFLCFSFFTIFLSSNSKIAALSVYSLGLLSVVFVGWFTAGSYKAVILEYRELLSSMLIPYQAVVVLGTLLPIALVAIGIAKLNKVPKGKR